ncbi:MAG: hypothetical protein GY711_20285 [bacterium]|nr:hypothetical protein [bacterium]
MIPHVSLLTASGLLSATAAFAASQPLSNAQPGPQSPAGASVASGLHPGDAVLYFEIPDVQALTGAYEASALGRLLADADVQAAIGAVMGIDSYDPLDELSALYDGAVERGELPPIKSVFLEPLERLSFSLSAKDGQIGPILRAMEGGVLPEGEDDVAGYLRGHLGLQVGFEFRSDIAAREYTQFVLGLLEGQGAELAHETHTLAADHGVRVTTANTGAEALPELRLFDDGKRVVLLAGIHSTGACLERLGGGGESIAASGALARGARHLSSSSGTTVFEGFSLIGDQLMRSIDVPDIGPLIDIAEGLFGPMLTMITRGGHWRVQLRGGRFVTEGFHATPANGPLDGLLASAPVPEGDFDLVHPEAIVGWVAHLDRAAVIRAIEAAGGGAERMDGIEDAFGFRPDRDLVEPLGSAVAWSLPPIKSLLAAPPLMVSVGLRDSNTFTRGVEGLFALLAAEARDEVAVRETTYRDMRMFTIEFTGEADLDIGLPIDPMGFFKPTVVVMEDRVFLTTLPSHAKREIRRLIKGQPKRHPLLAEGSFPTGASEVGFADWVSFLGKMYDGLVPLASMAEDMVGELPIDLASLPKSKVFTPFFQPATRWERRVEGGVLHHAESSFGPETPLAIVLGAVGGAAWVLPSMSGSESGPGDLSPEVRVVDRAEASDAPVAPDAPQPLDSAQRTHGRLAEVRVAITVYQLDQGGLPSKFADLAQPTTNYPKGFLPSGSVPPKDGWGRDLRYAPAETTFKLWSIGPDGVDQDGAGDDILSQ